MSAVPAAADFRTSRIPLRNGAGQIPVLGFGTLIPDPALTISATKVDPGRLETPKTFEDELKQGQTPGKILVAGQVHWIVPEIHSREDTTKLTAEVKRGKNAIDFDVPAEKTP